VFQRREAAGLGVKVFEAKTPAALLAAAMFARKAIKASLQAAGQIEIRPVDGEHERLLQHACVEAVRHRGKRRAPTIRNPSRVLATRKECEPQGFVPRQENFPILMTRERRPAIRALRGRSFGIALRFIASALSNRRRQL
jgi:hypothetical protein